MPINVVTPGQTLTRHSRRPSFPIMGTLKPFGLYPLMCTPVLPGETMMHAESKMRVLSMPIKHPMIGCWLETWLCYVKLTDINPALSQMFITETMSDTGYRATAANRRYFTGVPATEGAQIDWVKLCTESIHKWYFLDQGETARFVDGVPKVKTVGFDWTQNLSFTPSGLDLDALPSQNDDEQLTGLDLMTLMGMSEITYEKYLAQYGVKTPEVAGQPEILRYTRSWTQPTNTVEPSTGAPSACWSWSENMKAEKPRKFEEPGFLIWLGSVRPKTYHVPGRPRVNQMWGFRDWFPAYNLKDPAAGIIPVSSADASLFSLTAKPATAENWIVDARDLLNHGETFMNDDVTNFPYSPAGYIVRGSNASEQDLRGAYADDATVDGIYVSADALKKKFYYEGIFDLRIQGHFRDTTL